MASSTVQTTFRYEVFLSFRGIDTRKNIVDLLYTALQNQGICTFKDDEKLERGEVISEELVRCIEESRLHIIVFSKNFASSSWCLDELFTIMKCSKPKHRTAYPLFYDVEPRDVRNQRGAFGSAFEKHAEKEGSVRWKDALTKAAGLSGWELATFNGYPAKLVEQVVQDIKIKLHYINYKVDEKLVGMEERVDAVVSSLEIDRDDDVRIVGITGMGGAGKTTLSQAVFYEISFLFEGKSFVEKVGERCKSSGLKELQKQVLSDVLHEKGIVVNTDVDGKNLMGRMLPSRKALIVLDDVDDVEQLRALAGDKSWFKPGSRILITTRNEHMLEAHKVNVGVIKPHDIIELLLSNEDAICLFSRYAFGTEYPAQGYEELSKEVVSYAAGLPLTLSVLGAHLCGRSVEEWNDAIKRLKLFPEEKTMKVLKLSFEDLRPDEKNIFLDIACMLKGERKDVATRILEKCGYHAISGLDVLRKKSLVTVSNDDRLLMHDLIQEMGMYIVRGESPEDPSRHSRLWIKEEIEDILQNDRGTEVTRSIKLVNTMLHPDVIMKGLRNMKELRFIHVDSAYTTFEYVSPSNYDNFSLPYALKYLYWYNYPLCCLPPTFQAKKLVNLEMVRSNISQLWEGGEGKVLKELKFLNLENSHLTTFDIGTTQGLETLNLKECKVFEDLQVPDKHLRLKILNLGGCNVRNLDLLKMIPYLEKLTLTAKEVQHLPDSICMLRNLKFLKLESCWLLKQLPKNLDRLNRLEKLILSDCSELKEIPSSICQMKCLKILRLPYALQVKSLPEELGNLKCLKELNLEGACIRDLPKSIKEIKGLCIVWSRRGLERSGFTSFTDMKGYTARCYV